MNLTKLSIERPTLLAVIVTVLLFFGVFSYVKLSYELVPRFNPPVLTIATVYPGSSADEVETTVSIPIEDVVSSLENIDVITTISKESFSLVRLEMKNGTDIDLALQDASRKLQTITDKLPAGSHKPVLSRFDFNDLPVMRLALFSTMIVTEFTKFTEKNVLPELKKLPGVAEVRLMGGSKEEITVSLDPVRMAANHVSPLQVLKVMGSSNRNIPAGILESDDRKVVLKYAGAFNSIDDIKDLVIFENPQYNLKVQISDIAEVKKTAVAPTVITRLNGKPALGIDIKKQTDANAVDLSKSVNKQLRELENEFKKSGLKFEVAADSSKFTVKAADAVMEDLLLTILLVSLVMLVFLHSIRSAGIVLLAIPVSIISTFIVMELMGFSLNLLTLLGLSLAIGILVDDSIVVLENIHRHITMGKHPVKAAYDGRMEIGFTAISITLIDVVVFVPIILATGMVADLLRQFSVVIVCATFMSLFVSFTLVPLLSSRWGMKEKKNESGRWNKFGSQTDKFLDRIADSLVRAVNWSLKNKIVVLGSAFLLFAGSILLIPAGFIGIEFTKAGDRSEFLMEIELNKTSTIKKTEEITEQVEKILMNHSEVEAVFSNTGITSSGRIESNTSYLAEVYIRLTDKSNRNFSTSEFASRIKKELNNAIPGVIFRPIEINMIGLRDDDAVQVSLRNNYRDSLEVPAKKVVQLLESTAGATEIQTTYEAGDRSFEFVPDSRKMEELGIDPLQAGMTLRTLINGNSDFILKTADEELEVNIIANENYRKGIEDLNNYKIVNNIGQVVSYNQFGLIKEVVSQGTLERTNRVPSVTIKSQVMGKPAGTVTNSLNAKIADAKISEKADLLWGGASKRTSEALFTLGIAFAISIFLVYLVLVALYDSYFYPFVVLFSIPLALIGALSAMALAGQALSIFSVMGLIMLTGLVGKNAILIVDFANNLRRSGNGLKESVAEAVRLRFRPVIMTTLTIVIGLLPVALATGAGSEWKNGLAWALIGGLTSSLVLTLIIIPVIYYGIEKLLTRFGRDETSRKKVNVDDYK